MAWRTSPLPPEWRAIRRRVLQRDGDQCTAATPTGERCPYPATDVDHILPAHMGGDDSDENLTSLCGWCHRQKTSREAGQAAAKRRRKGSAPEPRHPGLA